ncbi:MAG: GDP-mannose 4,6-dehydratase, partial [Ardenticatenaceae bacterium]
HKMDIADYPALRALFTEGSEKFESIINLGARAGVRYSVKDPWVYYQANTIGNLNLLEMCREFEVKKFVLASTSSVYGDDTPRPFLESADTNKPLSPYAASKKAAEAMTYTYHHLYQIDATVFRFFTVYGPAGRPDMSVFIFTRSISEGETLKITGDGGQERDFTYVEDVARGVIAGLKPVGYEVINLGNDRPVVLMDMINMVEDCLEKKAKIEHIAWDATDVRATWASIDKARDLLGWEPQVTIEDGIRLTVDWYRNNQNWAKDVRPPA